jgi:hypothetical protein
MMATYAKKLLDVFRPAVAIALLWANSVCAQIDEQSGQQVDLRVTKENATNNGPVNRAGPAAQNGDLSSLDQGGPLRGLTLSLSAGLGYDDNVFRTENNTRSDTFWLVRPDAYFDFASGKHGYRLGYEGEYAHYFEHSTEDYDDHRLFATAEFDLTRKLDFNLGIEGYYGHDPRGSIGTRLIVPGDLDKWFQYSVAADLVIGRPITRAQIIPSIEFSGVRYLNNNQSIRDYDRQDFRLRGAWRFNPRFYGIAEGGFANIDHLDDNNLLDRTETDFLVGFGWQATAKTSGEALFGILYRDFSNPVNADNSNPTWDIRVHWAPKTYSKFTAYTRRSSRENAGGVGNFLADTYGLRWQHGFTSRFNFLSSIDYTVTDFSTPRQDDYVIFDVGLTYQMTRWLGAGVSYQYLNRRSNIPGIDYDDQKYLFELTAATDRALDL